MEEIEPSAMEINGGEEFGDEFYEKIEAPKFVDLSAPDRCRPKNDDRYWFCLRVGCDQKHEEEMDSEEIDKNFVLRVMAARSPNVRLRRALYGKDASVNFKCPRTVPAKSSKSRVSRLAMISSISQKMVDAKVKARPIPKQSATPNAKTKQSSVVAKALTTPRNNKRLSNPGTFQSVRNPKTTTLPVPKNRMVAKALIFQSPKNTIKLKKSVELSTSMRTICKGMKKLEITNTKYTLGYTNKPLPLDALKRQRKGREVKSRVFNSLHSQNHKGQEAKSSKCMKNKSKGKESKLCPGPVPREGIDNDSSDMEIEEKSRAGTLEVCSISDTSKSNKESGHEERMTTVSTLEQPLREHKMEALSGTSRSDLTSLSNFEETNAGDNDVPKFQATTGEINATNEEKIKSTSEEKEIPKMMESDEKENALCFDDKASEKKIHEEKIKSNSVEKEIPETIESNEKENALCSDIKVNENEVIESDEKENALNADDKVNENEVIESDDKENASASDDNRKFNLNACHFDKKKILGRHENSKTIQKVTKVIGKTPKYSSISAVTSAQGVKYRKPKPTNPKPFRLRTDERGILKEANMEKKIHLAPPLKETTTIPGLPGGNSQGKHQNAGQRNEKCLGQTECANHAHEDGEKESDTTVKDQGIGTSCSKTLKGTLKPKSSTTPRRYTVSTCQKTNLVAAQPENKEKALQKSEESLKRTKSPLTKQLANSRGIPSGRKKMVSTMTPHQLGVIKEAALTNLEPKEVAKPNESGASPATKASVSATSRQPSQRRRPVTIPKEPNFHGVHVPKSCTRSVA